LEKGEKVVQETRGWDEAKQKTITQREKEEAHDYRYFPDPDIPPVELDDEYITRVKSRLTRLPPEIRDSLKGLNLTPQVVEDLLDNSVGIDLLLRAIENGAYGEVARHVAFWALKITYSFSEDDAEAVSERMIKLAQMREANFVGSTAADEILSIVLETLRDPEQIAREKDLLQVSDEGEIEKIVSEVLSENPRAAEDVKNGETKAIGFLVGQVMKKSQGKANPQLATQLIKKHLGI
jgi:aspartyl-tRNA(Asn)/glutamyl-tRNA(Gln) amidotransferase subunit B